MFPAHSMGCLAVAAAAAGNLPALAAGGNAEPAAYTGALCAHAVALVEAAAAPAGMQATVRCGALTRPDLDAEASSVSLAGPAPALRTGAATVVLRARPASGGGATLVSVPIEITISSAAWRMLHPVAQGASLSAQDVERVHVEWPAGARPEPVADAPPTGRTRRALRAGELVSPALLAGLEDVARGDLLTVLLREGDLTIRTAGRAVATARPGEIVRAQLEGRQALVQGTLATNRTLIVEAR